MRIAIALVLIGAFGLVACEGEQEQVGLANWENAPLLVDPDSPAATGANLLRTAEVPSAGPAGADAPPVGRNGGRDGARAGGPPADMSPEQVAAMRERMANMTPEQLEAMRAGRGGGGRGGEGRQGGRPGGGRPGGPPQAPATTPAPAPAAQ